MSTAPIGILGGTFDPIHFGHLRLAQELAHTLKLTKVRFVPSGTPPHRAAPGSGIAHRVAMTRLAVDATLRQEMGAAARERFLARFSLPGFHAGLKAVYDEALDRAGR